MPNISAFFKKVQPQVFVIAFFTWAVFLTLAPPVEDVHDVLTAGDYAFLAVGKRGVRILDLTDPANPEKLGEFDTPGSANALDLKGDSLYVADGRGGLLVLDVSNLSRPSIRWVFEDSKSASDVLIKDNFVLVADRKDSIWALKADEAPGDKWRVTDEQGFLHLAVRGNFLSGVGVDEKFYVFNIKDITKANKAGSFGLGTAVNDMVFRGARLFLATEESGLIWIDNPDGGTRSRDGGTEDFGEKIESIHLEGHYLYLGLEDRVIVVDNRQPDKFERAEVYNKEVDRLTAISVHQGYLYLADGREGFYAIKSGSGLQWERVDPQPISPKVEDVHPYGEYIYLASCQGGVQVVEQKKDGEQLHGRNYFKNGPGCAVGLDIEDEKLFVAYHGGGVRVYDLAYSYISPQYLGVMDVGSVNDVVTVGKYAYAASGERGLQILDWENQKKVADVDMGDAQGVFVSGDYAYVADGNDGLKIINIAKPTEPELVEVADIPVFARQVFVHALSFTSEGEEVTLAFVAGGKDGDSGLWIIDVTDPADPEQVSFLKRGEPLLDVVVNGKRAYLSQEKSGLLVLDVSEPANPEELENQDAGGAYSRLMFVDGDIYQGKKHQGFQILDVSTPEAPQVVSAFSEIFSLEDFELVGNRVYAVDGAFGMWIFDVENPKNVFVRDFYDTPGQPHDVTVAGNKAYIADGKKGLHIVDLEDMNQSWTFEDLGDARGIAVKEQAAFLLDWQQGLVAVDISDLEAIEKVNVFGTRAEAVDISIAGWYAYLAEGEAGMQSVRVKTPNNMVEADIDSNWGMTDSSQVLALKGFERLYVADGENGLNIFDIAIPLDPTQLYPQEGNQAERDGEIVAVAVVENEDLILAVDRLDGMRVFNPASGTNIREIEFAKGDFGTGLQRIAGIDYSPNKPLNFHLIAINASGALSTYHGSESLTVASDFAGFYETPGRASLGDVVGALWRTGKATYKQVKKLGSNLAAGELSYAELPSRLIDVITNTWNTYIHGRVNRALVLAILGALAFWGMMLLVMVLTSATLLPVRFNMYTWWEVFYRLRRYLGGGHAPVVFAEEGEKNVRSDGFAEKGPSFVRVDASSAIVLEREPFVPRGLARWMWVLSGKHPRQGLQPEVEGTGVTFTRLGETVLGVADLRKQIRLRLGVLARTRDGIEVKNNVFALVTLGEDPDVIKVTYAGDEEKPENLRVVQLGERPPDHEASTSPYPVQVVSRLEDILDPADRREIHRFVQAYQAGQIIEPQKSRERKSGWRPFKLDEDRVFAALQSEPYDVEDKQISDWTEIAAHHAVETYRNELSQQTFDGLYYPEDSDKFPLSDLKNQVRTKVVHQGILAFEYVRRMDGFSFVEGQEWHPDDVETYPARELTAHKLLRSRGMKVITVGVTDLHPTQESVRDQYLFENWRATWEQDAMITAADHDLQVMRLKNQARVHAQRDLATTLKRILEMKGLDRDALAVRVYQALENVSADPATRKILPRDAVYTMRMLKSLLLPGGEEGDEKRFLDESDGEAEGPMPDDQEDEDIV